MKKAVFFIALIAGAFGFMKTADAMNFSYLQDFDSLPASSTITDFSGWALEDTNPVYTTTTQATSSTNSVSGSGGAYYSFATTTGDAFAGFSFYMADTGTKNVQIDVGNTAYSLINVSNKCGLGNPIGGGYEFSCDTWHTFDISIVDGSCTLRIDDVITSGTGATCAETYFTRLFFRFSEPSIYIDDVLIGGSTIYRPFDFITSFDETDFFPSFPVDCDYNFANATSGTMQFFSYGHFTNPPDSGRTYTGLYMYLENIDTYATSILTLIETPISENQDTGWSNSFEITAGEYNISYFASGTNSLGQKDDFWHNCPGTRISDTLSEETYLTWGICELDDCSGVSWWDTLEKLWCYIKNAGISLICPSEDVWKKTQSMASEIKQKVPFNYFSVAFSGVSNVADDASSSVATSTVMGTATDIDYDGLAHAIKNMFGAVSGNIVTILYWAISGLLIWKFGFEIIKYLAKELYT